MDEKLEFHARPRVAAQLTPEDMARHTAEGQAMTLDQSVAYALGIATEELAPTARAAG